jgi:XTP/dITP diphosphohydrolase
MDIMDDLREKCPWDKKQTITKFTSLYRMYELGDAILDNDLVE